LAAEVAGSLLLAFAIGIAAGTGVKSALNASVFAASGGAFVLAKAAKFLLSVDSVMSKKRRS
jgi:thiosulfate dehydrogenase (quinone) large subunit